VQGNKPGMQENKKAERRLAKKSFKKAQEERKKEGPFSWVFLFFFSDFGELSQMLRSVYGVRTDHLRLGRGSGWFGENSGE
jgi:hypothetical protein